MIVSGSYQGIPILDGEFSLKNGLEPSRGWVRCFLSDLGGELPGNASMLQVQAAINRGTLKQAQIQMSSSPGKDVDTTTTKIGKPVPPGVGGLNGPHGDLIMKTSEEGEVDGDTETIIPNIFWTEAIIEEYDQETGEGVVKIELADERILWGLGGYVAGWHNKTLNDVEHSVAGKIFEWDPAVDNPLRITEIGEKIAGADHARPILDDRYIINDKGAYRPWQLYELLIKICSNLPGPPEIRISESIIQGDFPSALNNPGDEGPTEGPKKIVPLNVDWGSATLAKEALGRFEKRYFLAMVPSYLGGFTLMRASEEAAGDSNFGGLKGAGGSVLDPEGSIAPQMKDPNNKINNIRTIPYKPTSIEVIGEKIYEEIACPDWTNVIREDGTLQPGDGFGKVGRWTPVEEWLSGIGWSVDQASASLMANFDKHKSKVFADVPGKDPEEKKKRQHALQQHFRRSFMVSKGPFRRFLPMHLKRPVVSSHALGLENMGIGQDARFFCDGFDPEEIRKIGGGPLFENRHLALVDHARISHIDPKIGIVTFKEPMGVVRIMDKYSFENGTKIVEASINSFKSGWDDDVKELSRKIAEWVDSNVTKMGDGIFKDIHYIARLAMNEFMQEKAGMGIGLAYEMQIDPTLIKDISKKIEQNYQETMPMLGSKTQAGTASRFNLTECQLEAPKMLGIWAWKRDWGRSDDDYRFRSGSDPAAPPYPIHIKDLVQYIDITGASNKSSLDVLAEIEADQFLESRDKAIAGSKLKYAGFHKIAMSGQMNEVCWRISTQRPPVAETECHKNRFQHGIAGRPPAMSTWASAQKPLVLKP